MRPRHCNTIMISDNFNTNHSNGLRLSGVYFSWHNGRSRFIRWKDEFTISLLVQILNLISFAIFIKQTAVVFSVPEKFTISSCAANAANLFFAGLNGNLVILLISFIIFLSKFLLVLRPVPTAVPPSPNSKLL